MCINNTEKFENRLLEENLRLKRINEKLKKEMEFTCHCINIMGKTIEELEEENTLFRERIIKYQNNELF